MRRTLALALLGSFFLACGPTLTRTSSGWHDTHAYYSVKPHSGGGLTSGQWKLISHERIGGGYRALGLQEYEDDLQFTRVEDDGMMVVVSEPLSPGSQTKLPSVLVDRWLDENVTHPDGGGYGPYHALVPPLVTTARARGPMIYGVRSSIVHGRNVEVVRRADFQVPGGTATEIVANLLPSDAPGPDRMLYLAVFKHATQAQMVIVGYANTPNMFERGVGEARELAHRITFR